MIAAVLGLMTDTCPTYRDTRRGMPHDAPNSAHERAAFTHALYCPTCHPHADQHRQEQADRIARLTAEADAEQRRAAIPVLHDTIKILEANGFHPSYLWDTDQTDRGAPIEECAVDIAGALAVTLYGLPTYAGTPQVRAVEELVAEQVDAPSLPAWYDHAQPDTTNAVVLLHQTARALLESP
ncbi:hypothetical protein [Streptomyces sp. ME01-18h]|uniref:DUF6197 family protein n=1 Tax=Streptomyces sp. ME01-18h TaxID=462920 RepID=UPI0029B82926|nr:hypothetical protein [Streptomyces sp. ME01-18h]MDX3398411.1 hypothetical protein [Streptomyces sp. ME01-18h]